MTIHIQLDAAGNEIDTDALDSGLAAPESVPGITFRDTTHEKFSVGMEPGGLKQELQADINDVARRARKMEASAMAPDVWDAEKNMPKRGCEELVRKRMLEAQTLREAVEAQVKMGNITLSEQASRPDPAVTEMQDMMRLQKAAERKRYAEKLAQRVPGVDPEEAMGAIYNNVSTEGGDS